jgi:hypothetical protein
VGVSPVAYPVTDRNLGMAKTLKNAANSRMTRYRDRQARTGLRRVEVAVPAEDAALIRRLAGELRAGGEAAERLRAVVGGPDGFKPARTGEELLAFFGSSPLVGEDVSFERDPSTGRPIDL